MLPDKNELNDKLIEQINGGLEDTGLIPPSTIDFSSDYSSKTVRIPDDYCCLNCGRLYRAYEKRTDGYCPNCESKPLETEIPTGDMKTTIPGISNKDKLVKIH